MEPHRTSNIKVIPKGYVVLHVAMTDMDERRVTRLRYFVAPGEFF